MSCRATKSGSSSARSCEGDRKSTRLNSSHDQISYAVFCLKKKKKKYRINSLLELISSMIERSLLLEKNTAKMTSEIGLKHLYKTALIVIQSTHVKLNVYDCLLTHM